MQSLSKLDRNAWGRLARRTVYFGAPLFLFFCAYTVLMVFSNGPENVPVQRLFAVLAMFLFTSFAVGLIPSVWIFIFETSIKNAKAENLAKQQED